MLDLPLDGVRIAFVHAGADGLSSRPQFERDRTQVGHLLSVGELGFGSLQDVFLSRLSVERPVPFPYTPSSVSFHRLLSAAPVTRDDFRRSFAGEVIPLEKEKVASRSGQSFSEQATEKESGTEFSSIPFNNIPNEGENRHPRSARRRQRQVVEHGMGTWPIASPIAEAVNGHYLLTAATFVTFSQYGPETIARLADRVFDQFNRRLLSARADYDFQRLPVGGFGL